MVRSDGTRVTVYVDKSFDVVSVKSGRLDSTTLPRREPGLTAGLSCLWAAKVTYASGGPKAFPRDSRGCSLDRESY
jgi:hypothetical protein